jgi:hypothetical protein
MPIETECLLIGVLLGAVLVLGALWALFRY